MTLPVTIITGVPRSGTTMLGDLANRYLDVGCANEGPFELWLAGAVKRDADLNDNATFTRVVRELAQHDYFTLVFRGSVTAGEIEQRLRNSIDGRTIEAIGLGVLTVTAEHMQLPHLGHEDPLLIDDLSKTFRIFPHCRLVQIIRDPRDVALSILKFPWGANNPVVAADDWNRKVAQTRDVGRKLGTQRYHELRYEDLLQTPRETMGALMTFLHGSPDTAKLDAYVAETEANPLRNNSRKWETAFTQRELSLIEGCAHEQMRAVGYEFSTSARPVSSLSRKVWRLRHRFAQVTRIASGKLESNGQAILEVQSP